MCETCTSILRKCDVFEEEQEEDKTRREEKEKEKEEEKERKTQKKKTRKAKCRRCRCNVRPLRQNIDLFFYSFLTAAGKYRLHSMASLGTVFRTCKYQYTTTESREARGVEKLIVKSTVVPHDQPDYGIDKIRKEEVL